MNLYPYTPNADFRANRPYTGANFHQSAYTYQRGIVITNDIIHCQQEISSTTGKRGVLVPVNNVPPARRRTLLPSWAVEHVPGA